jgi:hypothetical protein
LNYRDEWAAPVSEMPQATDNNAPIVTNGTTTETIAPVCARIHAKVHAFLEVEVEEELLKRVQEQTRIALGVIEDCLSRYRYAPKFQWEPKNAQHGAKR